ncbi:unnamed protein product, partial [Lampetra planeri]
REEPAGRSSRRRSDGGGNFVATDARGPPWPVPGGTWRCTCQARRQSSLGSDIRNAVCGGAEG